jgi:GntR family transcriptional regulator, transcriptional repressor for pyruvate dehydrogenase complex
MSSGRLPKVKSSFLAAQRCSESEIERIKEAMNKLQDEIDRHNVGSKADFIFHIVVVNASGNSWFASALGAIRTQIETTIEIARTLSLANSDAHLQAVQAEHVAVFEAIRRRDPEGARAAMREHLSRTRERIFRGSS